MISFCHDSATPLMRRIPAWRPQPCQFLGLLMKELTKILRFEYSQSDQFVGFQLIE